MTSQLRLIVRGVGRCPSRVLASALLVASIAGCTGDDVTVNRVSFTKPVGLVAAALRNPDFQWRMEETRHFRIFYEGGSHAELNLLLLGIQSERAVERALSVIQESSYARGSRIFVVDSRIRMNDLIGMSVKGYCQAENDVIFLVFEPNSRAYIRHEVMHLVSLNTWGKADRWMSEGAAMYADGECQSYERPLLTLAAYLLQTDRLLPIETLIDDFDEESARQDMVTYLQSGSLFEFLYERYGPDTVRNIWKHGPSGVYDAIGVSVRDLEVLWRDHLRSIDIDTDSIDWKSIVSQGCG